MRVLWCPTPLPLPPLLFAPHSCRYLHSRLPVGCCPLHVLRALSVVGQLLGVLRILGRGTCFDGIKELSGIGESTMQEFFHRFCRIFAKEIYPLHVYTPQTKEEVVEMVTPYAFLGMPGCLASMDVVHLAWGMCPLLLANICM